MIQKIAQFTDIRCCLVVGGLSTKVCILRLLMVLLYLNLVFCNFNASWD